MEGLEQPGTSDGQQDTQGDAEIEVSDVRSGTSEAPHRPPRPHLRSPFEARYTRRQRLARGAVGVLALLVVVSGITGVGGRVFGLFAAPTPTLNPVPTSAPNIPPIVPPPGSAAPPAANAFYLLPNPPGVTVSLDGHPLASLPLPGDPRPLYVSPGHHVLAWTSSLFPFQPLHCTLSAPHAEGDTCPFVSAQDLPADEAELAGHVIAMHDSLGALSTGEAPRLMQAIQGALNASVSETILQPGEHYYFYQNQTGGNDSPVAATQPLRATLSYDYVPDGYFEPCSLTQPAIPCRFPGQDCGDLCTVPQPPPAVVTSPNDWIAAVNVEASWSYATLDGKVLAQNLGEAFGVQLAILRIRWDGGSWGVTLVAGAIPDLPAADDLVCDPARFWLSQNGTWSFMMDDPPPGARTQFISDGIPTDGCLALLNPYPRGGSSAVFLEHCGVLLAVNATAQNGGSAALPMANAAELQLARQLASQAGVTIS